MEAFRDRPGLRWLEDVARDVSYGLRALGRSKGFTATALLSLALGIGANAGIFSLVDQVFLRPLAVQEPERLVQFEWRGTSAATQYGGGTLVSHPVCRELQQQDAILDGVFCRHPTDVYFSTGRDKDQVGADIVSGSYFAVLGVRPALGRLIDPSDDLKAGAHPVVVLSHDYWRNRLGAAPDVVGRQVLVNNHPMTVIGVAPAGFRGVDLDQVTELWLPAMMQRQAIPELDALFDRRTIWMHGFGRLKSGMTAQQARDRLQPWFKRMLDADTRSDGFPTLSAVQQERFQASTIELLPAARGVSNLRGGLQRPLRVLMGGTVILLLLATLNVAGLLLARGAARTRELTTRMALGASRGRVARQLLVESLLITLGGGVLGIVAAPLVSRLLRSFIPAAANLTDSIDRRVLMLAFMASLVTGALCSLAPVFQAGRLRLSAALTDRSGLGAGADIRVRKLLVAGQIAFALILMMAAGLFVQTLAFLQAKGPGFAATNLVMFGVDPTSVGYTYERSERAMREVSRGLLELPEVERAAVANTRMLNFGTSTASFTIQTDERRVTNRLVHFMRVGPGFFSTLGTQLVAGRDFDERDMRPPRDPQRVSRAVIVNETFARRYFGDRNPVGAIIGRGNRPDTPLDIEIIGVVREFTRRTLRDQDFDQVFFNYWDNQSDNGAFYVRVRGNPESAFASIRSMVAGVDPALPVSSPTTFEDQIDRSLSNERALATLSSGFGAIALLICVVGVMAFVATQRTQEIGMRLALGSTRAGAAWLVIRDALLMIGAGAAIAVPAAYALSRLVQGQLFGVGAFDAPTIATAGGGLAVVALAAAALPAWRAAVLPPMAAIRDQPESMWHVAGLKVRRAIKDLAAGSERAVAPVTLIGEFIGLVERADSFSEALQVALPALRQRAGAQSIMLLEKVSADEYRCQERRQGVPGDREERRQGVPGDREERRQGVPGDREERRQGIPGDRDDCSIPSRGVLINRLTHYPHPLPLTPADFEGWLRWARESRPEHVVEIERLRETGARMAVPLRTKREIVGVLLLGPPEGRPDFTGPDKQLLSSAAEVFALMIENARLNDRALEQERVRRDIALAAEVQRRLLPPQPPSLAAATLAAFTLPARSVGGDFYDFVDLPGDGIAIAVADIAGKGIAAALLTSVVQASLRVISAEGDIAASELAARMNRFLYRSTAANNYATFFYAQLDGDGRRLRYVNAGHNPPYLVRRTEAGVEITELCAGGTVLGLFSDVEYEDAEVDLRPGDLFVAFTDGLTEARDASGEEFGEDRLKDLLREAVGASAEDVSSALADQMREWIAGAEQHDDVTFVVATVN